MHRRRPDWTCNDCGNLVFGSKDICGKCGKFRSKNGPPVSKPGDWRCTNCNDLNFASRVVCRKCNTPKPPIVHLQNPPQPNAELLRCSVCFEREVNCGLPCGHVALCMECASNMRTCPFCRQAYNPDVDVKRVYIPGQTM